MHWFLYNFICRKKEVSFQNVYFVVAKFNFRFVKCITSEKLCLSTNQKIKELSAFLGTEFRFRDETFAKIDMIHDEKIIKIGWI